MNAWTHPFPPNEHLHFAPLKRVQQLKDSDGNSYSAFVQGEEFSCALAATAMLILLIQGGDAADRSQDEQRLKRISAKFPGSLTQSDALWSKEAPGKYGSLQFGTQAGNVKSLLENQKIKLAKVAVGTFVNGVLKAPAKIETALFKNPGMILWGWYPQGITGTRNGGHFTVAAGLTKAGKLVVLDPWDGTLTEQEPSKPYKNTGIAEVVFYTA